MDDADTPDRVMAAIGPMFPDVADHAPVPLFSTDAAGRYVFVNKRWSDLTGIAGRDALGWGWERALHPDDVAGVVDRWRRCVATGDDLHARMRLVRPDGRLARVHMHAVAAPGRRGRTGFVGTLALLPVAQTTIPAPPRPGPDAATDPERGPDTCGCLVAELKRVEASRRDQDERLTLLLAALPSPVLVADADRRVVAVNQAFCDLFGLPDEPAGLIGRDCAELARPAAGLLDEPAAFTARLEALLRRRSPVMREEVTLADGRVFERSHVPVRHSDAYRGHLWVYVEVTDRRIIEAETEGLIAAGVVTADGRLVLPPPGFGDPYDPEDAEDAEDADFDGDDRAGPDTYPDPRPEAGRGLEPGSDGVSGGHPGYRSAHAPAQRRYPGAFRGGPGYRPYPLDPKGPAALEYRRDGARELALDLRAPLASIVSYVGLLREGVAGSLSAEQESLMGVVAAGAEALVEIVSRGVTPWDRDRRPADRTDQTGPAEPRALPPPDGEPTG